MLANDLIVAIDGEQVQGLTINQAVEKMRGAVGSEVTLKIQRTGRAEPLELKLKRDVIRIRSVRFEKRMTSAICASRSSMSRRSTTLRTPSSNC